MEMYLPLEKCSSQRCPFESVVCCYMAGFRSGILLQTADEEVPLERLQEFGCLRGVGQSPVEGEADEDSEDAL